MFFLSWLSDHLFVSACRSNDWRVSRGREAAARWCGPEPSRRWRALLTKSSKSEKPSETAMNARLAQPQPQIAGDGFSEKASRERFYENRTGAQWCPHTALETVVGP